GTARPPKQQHHRQHAQRDRRRHVRRRWRLPPRRTDHAHTQRDQPKRSRSVLRMLVTSNKNKRERACLRGPSPSTSRPPGQAGTSGTQAYSNVLDARPNPDGANSANADVFHENQSSGFPKPPCPRGRDRLALRPARLAQAFRGLWEPSDRLAPSAPPHRESARHSVRVVALPTNGDSTSTIACCRFHSCRFTAHRGGGKMDPFRRGASMR